MAANLTFNLRLRNFAVLLCALLGFQIVAIPVRACSVNQSGPMPICGGLAIAPDTDVIVIQSDIANAQTNVLLGDNKHSASLLNVVIGAVERPVTIVVSNYNASVLRFSGNVDQVDQVITMGARRWGWDHVAVTGIDARKVTFLPVVGRDKNLVTNCSAPPKSCIPEQYFVAPKMGVTFPRGLPIDPEIIRMHPHDYIVSGRQSTLHIPRKTPPSVRPEKGQTVDASDFKWPVDWQEEVALYNNRSDGLVAFNLEQLISPTPMSLAQNLPSWAGIVGLVETGQIRPAGDYSTDKDLIKFSEASNKKYRTRFDPEFTFEPPIDFVMTHPMRGEIPRDLTKANGRPVVFLRHPRMLPGREKGDTGRYCFLSIGDKLSQPRHSSDNKAWRAMCKPSQIGRQQGLSPTLAALQLDAAIKLENHRHWKTQLCPLFDIPHAAKVIVLSTQHGRTKDGLAFRHCGFETSLRTVSSGDANEVLGQGIAQCEAGELDVKIDLEGPVFLFLKGRGALQWNFEVSEKTEISGVVSVNSRRQMVTGLPKGTRYHQYKPGDPGLPDQCGNSLLDVSPLAGGPAIELFELMLSQTSGRRIDLLFNKGLPQNLNPSGPEEILKHTTFVVR